MDWNRTRRVWQMQLGLSCAALQRNHGQAESPEVARQPPRSALNLNFPRDRVIERDLGRLEAPGDWTEAAGSDDIDGVADHIDPGLGASERGPVELAHCSLGPDSHRRGAAREPQAAFGRTADGRRADSPR